MHFFFCCLRLSWIGCSHGPAWCSRMVCEGISTKRVLARAFFMRTMARFEHAQFSHDYFCWLSTSSYSTTCARQPLGCLPSRGSNVDGRCTHWKWMALCLLTITKRNMVWVSATIFYVPSFPWTVSQGSLLLLAAISLRSFSPCTVPIHLGRFSVLRFMPDVLLSRTWVGLKCLFTIGLWYCAFMGKKAVIFFCVSNPCCCFAPVFFFFLFWEAVWSIFLFSWPANYTSRVCFWPFSASVHIVCFVCVYWYQGILCLMVWRVNTLYYPWSPWDKSPRSPAGGTNYLVPNQSVLHSLHTPSTALPHQPYGVHDR